MLAPQTRISDHYHNTFLVGPASADTLDVALAETGIQLFAVDFRRAPTGTVRDWLNAPHAMRTIGATYNEFKPSAFFSPIPPSSFDVIFFVNQTSPSRENPPLPKQMERISGRDSAFDYCGIVAYRPNFIQSAKSRTARAMFRFSKNGKGTETQNIEQ